MKDKRDILKEIRDRLVQNLGEDIHDVILFGSRANNRENKHSVYDVLIILNKDYDWKYENSITSILYKLELKHVILINTKVIVIFTQELKNTIKENIRYM